MATYQDIIYYENFSDSHQRQGLQGIFRQNRGTGITIAILSTGIINHPLVNDKVIGGKNFTTDNGGVATNYSEPLTESSRNLFVRGTMFASIIASGVRYNPDGTEKHKHEGVLSGLGIAPDVNLLIGKVKTNDGIGTLQQTIDGINWAKDWIGPNEEKVDIILLDHYTTVNEPTYEAAINAAANAGKIIVASTANTETNTATTVYPAMYSNVISFISVDRSTDDLSVGDYPFRAKTNPNIVADLAVQGGWPFIYYASNVMFYGGSDTNVNGAVGAGFLALLLQAYKEAKNPLTSKDKIMTEITKYVRAFVPSSNATLLASKGMLQINRNLLPNEMSATSQIIIETKYVNKYVPVEVPVTIVKKIREIVVPISAMNNGGNNSPTDKRQQILDRINKLNSMQKK